MAKTVIPGQLTQIPGQTYSLLSIADLDPTGASVGYAPVYNGSAIVWAPAASAPTLQKNTTAGTVALTQVAWRIVVHAANAATAYQFPASPNDRDSVEIEVSSAGTGSITLDGNGHNIEQGTTSAATFGPTTSIVQIGARFYAADNVWRLY
jgi:hypothetical protein